MIAVSADTRAAMVTLDILIKDIDSAPVRFNALAQKIVLGRGGVKERLARELTPYPGAVKRPIRWKSARQRRAYFASNGFGRGIPSRRTGRLQNAWEITYRPLTKDGVGSITIANTAPEARFVIGPFQQPF